MRPRIFPAIFVLALLWVIAIVSTHAATPQPVQFCPISANQFAVPKNPTDSLRSLLIATNTQGCVAYQDLMVDKFKLYGGTPHNWNTPAALGIAAYQAPTTPPVTPPVTPPTPVPADYTVTVDGVTDPNVAATFKSLDSTQQQCFTVKSGTKVGHVCL